MAAEGLGSEASGKGPALGDRRALPMGLGLGWTAGKAMSLSGSSGQEVTHAGAIPVPLMT